jgi:hypothetical protein
VVGSYQLHRQMGLSAFGEIGLDCWIEVKNRSHPAFSRVMEIVRLMAIVRRGGRLARRSRQPSNCIETLCRFLC